MKKYLVGTICLFTGCLLSLALFAHSGVGLALASQYSGVFTGAAFSDACADSVRAQADAEAAINGTSSPVVIGGRVWLDEDGDGMQDPGEPGLRNVELTLQPLAVAKVAKEPQTTLSDANGDYVFRGLFEAAAPNGEITWKVLPGYYRVEISADSVPAGLVPSSGFLISDTIEAATGGTFLDVAFAFENTNPGAYSIVGDLVWRDYDGDGIRDPGEPGIGGVTLDLVGDGSDLTMTTEDDDYDTYDPVETAGDGTYFFQSVLAGMFMVDLTDTGGVLDGCTVTGSWDPTVPIRVGADLDYLNADFGCYRALPAEDSVIESRIWYDSDRDGIFDDTMESSIRGVTVNLLNADGTVIATALDFVNDTFKFYGIPDGTYTLVITDMFEKLAGAQGTTAESVEGRLEVVVPDDVADEIRFGYVVPDSVGGRIFSDADGDGVRDMGEPGIENVEVAIYQEGGGLVGSQTTGPGGEYLFEGLADSGYYVSVAAGQAVLAQYVSTTEDQMPGTGGVQLSCDLVENDGLTGLDFAFFNDESQDGIDDLADISGNLWNDYDKSGLRDLDEGYLAGVIVALERVLDTGGTEPEYETCALAVTGSSGGYLFADVAPGDYRVNVVDYYGRLEGYILTSELTEGTDHIEYGPTPSEPFQLDEQDLERRFGFVRDPRLGVIGDTVWHDLDADGLQDDGEPGIQDATVRLYNQGRDAERGTADDFIVDTVFTNENGIYWFTGLPAGNYYAVVVSVPGDFVPSPGMSNASRLVSLPIPLNTPPDDLSSVTVDDIDFGFVGEETATSPDLGNTRKTVKDLNGGDLLENDILEYKVVIYNSGDGTAMNAIYDDTPDEHTTIIPGSVTTTKGHPIGGNHEGDTEIKVSIGYIDPGKSVTITYRTQVDEGTPAGTMIMNQGIVEADNSPPEPTDFPNTSTPNDPTVIGPVVVEPFEPPVSELDCTKTGVDVNGGRVRPGDEIRYEVGISNAGPDPAINLIFSDSVPMNTTYVADSLTSTQGEISEGPPLLVNIGDLAVDATVVITYSVVIDPDTVVGTVITNQGSINGDNDISDVTDDPSSPGDDEPTQIIVQGDPNLEVYKSAIDVNGEYPRPGDILEYTLRTTNAGDDDATGVVLYDTPSTLVSLVPGSVTTTAGTVVRGNNPSDDTVEVNIGEIAPEATVTVAYQAQISLAAQDGDQIVNQGVVASNELPDEPSDDPDTGTPNDPTVITVVDRHLAAPEAYMTVDGDRPTIRWEMVWINQEPSAPVLAKVFGPVPEDTAYVEGSLEVSGGAAYYDEQNKRIVWDGTLAQNGGQVVISYETTVSETVYRVENQGFGMWDENDDGIVNEEPVVLTDDPNTPEIDDPTVWYDSILAPEAYMTVDGDRPNIRWEMTWINQEPSVPVLVQVFGPVPDDTTYVEGSLEVSDGTAYYDEQNNRIVWDGTLAENGGQVVISYETTVSETVYRVENQGFGLWDRDGDGIVNEEPVVLTDDPNTPEIDDPTVWYESAPAPEAYMTADGDRPTIRWEMQWENQDPSRPILARVHGPIPADTVYVPGSLEVSGGTAYYDAQNNRIVWDGILPAGPNAVAISYETTVSETVDEVANQGYGVWDENGNGSVEDEIAGGEFAVLTDNPDTPEIDDPTVWYAPILAPEAYKTVYEDNYVLYWELRWVNEGNLASVVVHVEDVLPTNTPYIAGSLQASSGVAYYDKAENKIVWDGEISGSGGEVTITFRTSTKPTTMRAVNQGYGYYDEGRDGDWQDDAEGGQDPVLTDDPDTPEVDDPTVWDAPPCTECGPFKPF